MPSSSETTPGSSRPPKRRRQRRGNSSSSPNSGSRRGGGGGGGGGRRRQRDRDRDRDKSPARESATTKPPKKEGFLSRLLGALGLGGSSAADEKRRRGEPKRVPRKRAAVEPAATAPRQPKEGGERRRKEPRDAAPKRAPEILEVTNPRLYVGNLSYDATESDLFELFNGIGQVKSAEVVSNRHTHRSKGFAFVEMLSVDDAKRAVEVLHDQDFMGRKLLVSGAKSEGTRSGPDASDD